MEALKQYLRENIIFDTHDDEIGWYFQPVLLGELDRIGIYHSDNRKFFDIDPEKVIQLAATECFIFDPCTTITDIAREAAQNLALNYMYSELYDAYMEKLEV